MNMVEKVVTQIAKLEGCNIECNHCRKIAKAAILAMREPTEEMLSVDFKNDFIIGEGNHDRLRKLIVFQAMIDAALKE